MKSKKTLVKEMITKKKTGVTLKNEVGTTKYVIHAEINVSGRVERPDVVGAIFGQTEGLLGEELDLRELQKTGRIGRIKVTVDHKKSKTLGTVTVPSSLDMVETAILGASLETIDRIGPCEATIKVLKTEDVRTTKRTYVVSRAKEILQSVMDEQVPETAEITEEVKKSVRIQQITKYGKDNLPAGPNVTISDAVIVVEGRADVLNLLRNGIKNAIAVEGTSIPKTIVELSSKKTVTTFVDGDRGGELILQELVDVADVDYVTQAPPGMEVEELSKKEIITSLRNKIPLDQAINEMAEEKKGSRKKKKKKGKTELKEFDDLIKKLPGTLDAYLFDDKKKEIAKISVKELIGTVENSENVHTIIFDGVITQRLVDISSKKNIKRIIGVKIGDIAKKPPKMKIMAFK
ncbi:MAG: DNA primase DnaG [Euryarchaeota archaeon]|nr:DNA primase DnaG [Euryarchaeota archaeon]